MVENRPLIFTKCGLHVDPATQGTVRDLSPATLRAECESSLRRLGVERLDLLQLHWPRGDLAAAWETLGDLQAEGKIRWRGVSNFSIDEVELCAASGPVEFLQSPLSLLNRDAVREVLPWADSWGVPVIAYSPLESGLLGGGFTRERVAELEPGDWRARRPAFREPALGRALALVDLLRPLARAMAITVAELSVAWVLSWRSVQGAIVGARTPAQVDAWIGAADVRLESAELDRIAAALKRSGAGSGPVRPADPQA